MLVAVTLVFLGRIEDFVFRRRTAMSLQVNTDPDPEILERMVAHFEAHGLRARPLKLEKQRDRFRASYEIVGSVRDRDAALQELGALEGVRRITVQ